MFIGPEASRIPSGIVMQIIAARACPRGPAPSILAISETPIALKRKLRNSTRLTKTVAAGEQFRLHHGEFCPRAEDKLRVIGSGVKRTLWLLIHMVARGR